MVESACEGAQNCNKDQRSFKAYLSRWLAVTAQIAPFTAPQIMPLIQDSAEGAMTACVQASGGIQCGRRWNIIADDGERDIGNQMSAMSIVQANLVMKSTALADLTTGISESNPEAGGGAQMPRAITRSDIAGASAMTVMIITLLFAGGLWLVRE
jgi:Glycosyl hydrolase family 76